MRALREEIDRYLVAHGEPERLELLLPDMHGVFRGKMLPKGGLDKLAEGALRFPISVQAVDVFGEDVDGTGLALRGDGDGAALGAPGTLAPTPWRDRPSAQVVLRMMGADGAASIYDPRTLLERQLARAAALGLRPVAACELEFFLIAPRASRFDPPAPPDAVVGGQLYDYEAIERHAEVLDAIERHCAAQNIPLTATGAEYEPGQFEINFAHREDLLRACDDALLFRRVVKAAARAAGLEATFMPKPYPGRNASGLHIHMSLLDRAGRNLFDGGDEAIAPTLRWAIAGMIRAAPGTQAIFAPHANGYRRLAPKHSAPMAANWGLDHRDAAIRALDTRGPSARFEHRLAGADANPFLAMTAILAACLDGIEAREEPPPPIGEAGADRWALSAHWPSAVAAFAVSDAAERAFGAEYRRVFAEVRRQEIEKLGSEIPPSEYAAYLHRF